MLLRVIDGDRWIANRLDFLRGLLDGGVSGEQRRSIEAEIEMLSRESGVDSGGVRIPRLWRRLRIR